MNTVGENAYELLYLYHAGNPYAEKVLYNSYRGYIRTMVSGTIRSFPGSSAIEEDLLQEALISFSRSLDEYRDDMNAGFQTFMILSVKRRVWNLLRHYRGESQIPFTCLVHLDQNINEEETLHDRISQRDPMNEPEFSSSYHDLQDRLNRTYHAMSVRDRDVYESWCMGEKYEEAAVRCACTVKSYGARLQKVRRRVHSAMECEQNAMKS
jgi:RNA polymerase sigma factor (sigma-70 family)